MLHPPASQRVLSSPELLSLIFGFLSHTDCCPRTDTCDEDEDHGAISNEIFQTGVPTCNCSCSQCIVEESNSTRIISLPSPFVMPLVSVDHDGKEGVNLPNGRWKGKETMRGDEDEDPGPTTCHCRLSTHRQLSALFNPLLSGAGTSFSGPNRPSYNLNNALVCKTWSSVALDVLWRVVDRPERLFALLDGAWGSKLVEPSSWRLRKLRGLCLEERGKGQVPGWWKPGVNAFLELNDDEDDEAEESASPGVKSQHTRPKQVRRRQYELYSFRATPTPTSWSRFDTYSRRVKHLIYTRPCLSSSALNAIAVTRPRLAVLPKMHSLSWADNPLNHAVVFMHEGVKSLELRIGVFGAYKIDRGVSLETVAGMYSEMGLEAYEYSNGDWEEGMGGLFSVGSSTDEEDEKPILPNKTLTRTLAAQLSEIPRRMPNIQTLCISSFIPASLYLPALLCTIFRRSPYSSSQPPAGGYALPKLRHLTLPRYYTSSLLLERLVCLPSLEVLQYEWDEGVGWGRPMDVSLGRCVPEGWKTVDMDALQAFLESNDENRDNGFRKGWLSGFFGRGRKEQDGQLEEAGAEDDGERDEADEAATAEMLVLMDPSSSPIRPSPKSRRSRSSRRRRSSSHAAPRVRICSYGLELVEDDLPPSSPLRPGAMEGIESLTAPTSMGEGIFGKLSDLSLTIPICEAKKLLLSSPPAPPTSSSENTAANPTTSTPTKQPKSIKTNLPPTWPQNLVCLHVEAPPGVLSSAKEVGEFIRAIALACYGAPSNRHHSYDQGNGNLSQARLERLGIVCCADPESGCEALFGRYIPEQGGDGDGKLSFRTIEPLLEVLPASTGLSSDSFEQPDGRQGNRWESNAASSSARARVQPSRPKPKFALKSFEISHHLPMDLTQDDVEVIAERWGGCLEKLSLCCEPMAVFGVTRIPSTTGPNDPPRLEEADRHHRRGTMLTLAALLPFARHCTELRELGLFVDATRGVKWLVGPLFDQTSPSSSIVSYAPSLLSASLAPLSTQTATIQPNDLNTGCKGDNVNDIDTYTKSIALRYLSGPLSNPDIPHAYPVFRSLVRLNLGVSVVEVGIGDLEESGYDGSVSKGKEKEDTDTNSDEADSDDEQEDGDEDGLRAVLREAARARVRSANSQSRTGEGEADNHQEEYDDELDYIRRTGVRLGLLEEDEIEASELLKTGSVPLGLDYSSTSSLVPIFLAQILPCFPAPCLSSSSSSSQGVLSSNSGRNAAEMGCFTTIIEAGMTWSASAPSLMASSRAVEENWDVGEPYEVEKARQRSRKEKRRRQEQSKQGDEEVQEDPLEEVREEYEDDLEPGRDDPTAGEDADDYREYSDEKVVDDEPVRQPPQESTSTGSTNQATVALETPAVNVKPVISPSTGAFGSITIPFLPLPPTFGQPQGYYPPLLSALVRARVDKWTAMNEQILPMAVAMREGAWVWGGRVARELGRRRREVDELSIRVDVMDGLRQVQQKNRTSTGRGKEEIGVPDGCTII